MVHQIGLTLLSLINEQAGINEQAEDSKALHALLNVGLSIIDFRSHCGHFRCIKSSLRKSFTNQISNLKSFK